jgi:hypothetical protein
MSGHVRPERPVTFRRNLRSGWSGKRTKSPQLNFDAVKSLMRYLYSRDRVSKDFPAASQNPLLNDFFELGD